MLINDASITGSLIVNASASFQNISVGGNIIPDETNIRNLGSTDKYFKEIYVSTSSINFVDNGTIVATLNAGTINAIQTTTASANTRLDAIENFTSSLNNTYTTDVELNASSSTLQSNIDTKLNSSSFNSFTASVSATNTFTSSATSRLNALETTSASVDTLNTTQNNRLGSLETISASNISRISALETTSASVDTLNSTQNARLSALETTSASVDSLNTIQNTRLTNLEIKTGSLATTGSNTFIGTQTITGSLFISADLVVQGSSSLQNITASAVSIGTNIVNLNTANPAIRYAGLVIGDSGSIGSSGSFLYDSVQDEMIFVHRGANTTVTSSVVLMGPQTYDSIGSETYPTLNIIQKGTGNEHLVDSCIIDDGTTTCIKNNLVGTGTACFSNTICTPQISINSTLQNPLSIVGSNTGGTTILLQNTSTGGDCWRIFSTGAANGEGAGNLLFNNSCGVKMMINSSGYVGINNASPNRHLSIKGVGEAWNENITTATSTQCWLFGQDGVRKGFEVYDLNTSSTRLFVAPTNGYVGVGLQCPTYTFHTYCSNYPAYIAVQTGLTGSSSEASFIAKTADGLGLIALGADASRGLTDAARCDWAYSLRTGGCIRFSAQVSAGTTHILLNPSGVTCFASTICAGGRVSAINSGVDGTFADAFVGIYSGNSNEQNAIQTAVSSNADGSGFLFMVSCGAGLSTRACGYRMVRNRHTFYTDNTPRLNIDSSGIACFSSVICPNGVVNRSTSIVGFPGDTRLYTDLDIFQGYYSTEACPRFSLGRDVFISGGAGLAVGRTGTVSMIGDNGNGTALMFSVGGPVGCGASYLKMCITSSGHITPGANGTQNLGSSSLRWNTVYTSDLDLSNGIGDYTIVEGENDLFLYNNKQCKVYKFMLEQVCAECATPKKI